MADTPTVDDLHERMDSMQLRPRPTTVWKEFNARCMVGDLPAVYRESFVVNAAELIERKDKRIMALELEHHNEVERLQRTIEPCKGQHEQCSPCWEWNSERIATLELSLKTALELLEAVRRGRDAWQGRAEKAEASLEKLHAEKQGVD